MTEEVPESGGPSLEEFGEVMRKATLQGMKDYDAERATWEDAVAAEEKARKDAEDNNLPKKSGGLGGWLLGGSKSGS